MPSESDPNHRWYIVHTLSGYEARVVETLSQRVEALGLKAEVSEILVPTEKVEESPAGRPARGKRTAFPGYILIRTAMSDAVKTLVRNTPKVTGFVGGQEPTPLADEEVQSLLGKATKGQGARRRDVRYDVGDTVRVTDGPYANFDGVVERDDPERGMLRLTVTIFSRVTLIEVSYGQVEKS